MMDYCADVVGPEHWGLTMTSAYKLIETDEAEPAAQPLPQMHAALFEDIKDFDDTMMVAMIKAAGWVAMGVPIAPSLPQKAVQKGAQPPLPIDRHVVIDDDRGGTGGHQTPHQRQDATNKTSSVKK
jgi:hypothetical protein